MLSVVLATQNDFFIHGNEMRFLNLILEGTYACPSWGVAAKRGEAQELSMALFFTRYRNPWGEADMRDREQATGAIRSPGSSCP